MASRLACWPSKRVADWAASRQALRTMTAASGEIDFQSGDTG